MTEQLARDADDQWLETLIEGLERGRPGVPSGPPPEVQAQFVGWSGEAALRECFPVYRLWRESIGKPVPEAHILDFGVGWGRLIRFFGRDATPANLHGVDVDGDILEVCAQTGVPGNLQKIDPDGVLPYADDEFDLAYAYSVFSHLAEPAARHWFEELSRCVTPGGLLALTTQGARFLQLCRAVRDKPGKEGFELTIDGFFADPHRAVADYEAGRFVFAPTGGGGVLTSDFYGWAAVPPQWIEANVPGFTIERVVDDPAVNEQVVILLRRREGLPGR